MPDLLTRLHVRVCHEGHQTWIARWSTHGAGFRLHLTTNPTAELYNGAGKGATPQEAIGKFLALQQEKDTARPPGDRYN